MEDKPSIFTNSMQYGAITGFGLIIFSLLIYFLDMMGSSVLSLLSYAILIAGIVYGSFNIKKGNDNIITYGKALGSGTLISVFAGIILGFYTYVFYLYIDPDAMVKLFELMEQGMIDNGTPQDQIDMSLEISKKFMTPTTLFFGVILSFSFYGFLFSLITSIFVKYIKPKQQS